MDQDIKTVIQYPVGATEFDIPFDYLSRKFVRVSLVSDDNRRLLSNITEYRYVSKTRVKLLVATTGFDRVEIRRFTSASERIVDFSDGSVLRATDINVSQLQSAHIAEEARDAALLAMPEDDAGNLDARNRKIVRLAPGETGTDAVNKNQLDTTLGEAGGILSEVKDLQKDIEDYLQNWGDDTTAIRGVLWVYNQGSAVGGETSFVITKEGPVLAVPYIEINGSRQYRGWHYEYDLGSKTITLAKPLSAGDLVVCTTAETTLPLADSLAGPTGASQVGTSNGLNVQIALDNLRSGVNVLDFMTFAERAAVLNYTGTNDNSEAFRKAFATGSRQIIAPPGRYHVKDVEIPSKVKLFGTYSYKPYNVTSDASFGTDGTIIRKVAGADNMFLWNTACAAEGVMFDGRDRTSPAIQSKSGGKISVGFFKCGFYRFDRVGNRRGAYIGCSFQFCNFNQNNIGIYNTVDGNHIGCTINANKSHGVMLETGANSNTFTNCRNEWNEGDNWNFYGATSIQVINELCDRAFGYGFRISNSSVTLINVNIRRSARTAASGAASAQIYFESSTLKMIGVNSSVGDDDTGGSITEPSPDYFFRMAGTSEGRLEISDSRLTGYTVGLISGTARPSVIRVTNSPGWEDTINEGIARMSGGRPYIGTMPTATGPANVSPAVLGLSCGGVNTYDNDMFDIHLTIRNTNNGGHNGAILTVLLYREGGAARATIVRVDSRSNAVGEGDVNSTSADPQQVYQVSVEATSNDASTFNLLVSTKSDNSASYRFRAKVKP
jgi:hypothetical protein